MSEEEREAVLVEIKEQIITSLVNEEDEDAAEWGLQRGILLTRKEAITLLDMIPGAVGAP